MKKIKILKKAICLVTTLTFVIGLSACSTKKDLFKEDDVLNYIPYYDNGNEANRKINISPEGARLFSEKNFYKVEDDEKISFYSLSTNSEVYSVSLTNITRYDELYFTNSPLTYLRIIFEDDASTIIDSLGNVIFSGENSSNINLSVRVTNPNDNFSGSGSYDIILMEKLQYSFIDENGNYQSITNEYFATLTSKSNLSFNPEDTTSYTIDRKTPEEYMSATQFVTGDSFQNVLKTNYLANSNNGYYTELEGKMKGYYSLQKGDLLTIYNNKDKVVSIIDLPSRVGDSQGSTYAIMGQYLFVQSFQFKQELDKDYDFALGSMKYDYSTYCVNLKNGKKKEIKKFNYLIFELYIEKLSAKDKDGCIYTAALYSPLLRIEDKQIVGNMEFHYFDSTGKILSDKNVNNVFAVEKLDETHYIAYDMSFSPWVLNDKFEKKVALNGNYYSISLSGKVIAIEKNNYFDEYLGFINFDGVIVENFRYSSDFELHDNGSFRVTELNGKSFILTFRDGGLSNKFDITDLYRPFISNGVSVTVDRNMLISGKFIIMLNEYGEERLTIYDTEGNLIKDFQDVTNPSLSMYYNSTLQNLCYSITFQSSDGIKVYILN